MTVHVLSWVFPPVNRREVRIDHKGVEHVTVTIFDRRCDRCGILLMVSQPEVDLDRKFRDCDEAVVRRVMES